MNNPSKTTCGDFELLDELGQGGMATVWRARHRPSGRAAAVKVIQSERAQSESFKRAFRREVQSTARLEHPSIVRVYDYGVDDDGSPYLAMECVEGGTLRKNASALADWEALKRLLLEVLDALAFAHARELIHRDLKPENILVAPDLSELRLADFGIAYPLDPHRNDLDADSWRRQTGSWPAWESSGSAKSPAPAAMTCATGCGRRCAR